MGAWHVNVGLHTESQQSVPVLHRSPPLHGGQEPPQSTSDSQVFRIPSGAHPAASGEHTPARQFFVAQSVPEEQSLPLGQRAHRVPPQSTSVSVPFFAPSVHDAGAHTPVEHEPLAHSVPDRHAMPVHLRHGPPQSVPVSVPFWMPSLHDVVAQIQLTQLAPFWQSVVVTHDLPIGHLEQSMPPQSMSDSVPFLTRSVQDEPAHAVQRRAGEQQPWGAP